MIKFYLNKCSVKGPFTFCPRALYNTLQTYVLALHKFSHTLHWCLSCIACILVVAFCSCIYCDKALSSLFFPSLGIIVNMYNINGSGSNNKNWLKHSMLQLTSIKVPENFLLSLMTIMMATMGIMLMEEIEIREPTPSAQLGNFILLYSVGLKSMAVNNRMAYRKQQSQIYHASAYYWLYIKKKIGSTCIKETKLDLN